jgi:3-dehydroquinate synthase
MRIIEIQGSSQPSTIRVGEAFANLPRHLPPGKAVVITDENVLRLYRDRMPALPVLSIGSGEAFKTLETVSDLYEALVDLEADRATFILGVGGGIVCDVAGFVAATYLRGLRFGFAATTLLAQVDASVGGKNGVNLEGYKNLVGTIRQPEFVICDPAFLETLPEAEVVNGMAEIVKHGLIADAGMFAFLEDHASAALRLEPAVVERLVAESVVIKAGVVGRDEVEAGERRKLNFGHTVGHALEKTGVFSHGEAVSIGMAFASRVSVRRGLLPEEAHRRILALLSRLKLPVRASVDPLRLVEALRRDKKRRANRIHFVLLEDIGRAVVQEIRMDELEGMAAEFPDILQTGPDP